MIQRKYRLEITLTGIETLTINMTRLRGLERVSAKHSVPEPRISPWYSLCCLFVLEAMSSLLHVIKQC